MIAIIIFFTVGVLCACFFDKRFIINNKPYEIKSSEIIQAIREGEQYGISRKSKEANADRPINRSIDCSIDVGQVGDGGNGGKVLQIDSRR